MPTVKAGNISKGLYLNFKGTPHFVTKSEFHSPGKGSAFCKVKMKNIKTGASLDFTYKSSEQIEYFELDSQQMQFLYMDGDQAIFMNPTTYEQVELDVKLMDGKEGFLTSDIKLYVLFQDEKALGVTFPPKVKMTVKVAEEATAGNRVNAPKKPITLETGLEIYAPLFIKPGDVIMVATDSFDYVSRVNE